MDKDNPMKEAIIVVLGAKPKALLPDVAPLAVVAANGSAEVALYYRKKFGTKIISMVPGKDLYEQEHIRDSIKKAQPDELLLLGDVHITDDPVGYARKELSLKDDVPISVMSLYDRNWSLTKSLGWRRYVLALANSLSRHITHPLLVAFPDILTARNFDWNGRSTGINGLLYSLQNFPEATKVVAAGIGLQAGGHFNNAGVFKVKTAQADRLVMKYWVPSIRPRVFTTDDVMSDVGRVPKWEGPLFERPE